MFDTVDPSCLGENILTLQAVAVLTTNTLRLTCRKKWMRCVFKAAAPLVISQISVLLLTLSDSASPCGCRLFERGILDT